MGFKLKRVEVKLAPNEEKELVIVLNKENRAAIHGVVKSPETNLPIEGAIVKLFKKVGSDPCNLVPVTFAFTDKCGQFLFGVESNVEYVIKIFFFVPECMPSDKNDRCDC